MTNYQITFFGPFSIVADDGDDLTPRGAKAKALLVLLLAAPDHRRARRWLESKLWSDRDASQASGSLRQTLTEIRGSFGRHCALLRTDRINVRLEAEQITSDLDGESPHYASESDILEGLDARDPEFEDG